MGAQACGQQRGDLSNCSASSCYRDDGMSEYKPIGSQGSVEAIETNPPQAVVRQQADDSTESYFARELLECAQLQVADQSLEGNRPLHRFSTGATYTGQWKGNERHGIGMQEWPDGAKFIGCWRNNLAEGHGRFEHADGDVFTGQWRNNAAEGVGKYFHKSRTITYMGEWVEDMQHGSGVEQWEGGARIYHWPDGSKYMGQWRGNSITGFGHYIGKDGREFRGTWKEAIIHGCGFYSWPDGRTYRGQYDNDQKDGHGVFTGAGGKRFEGQWKAGKQHGWGVSYDADGGVVKQGIWNEGRIPVDGTAQVFGSGDEVATNGNGKDDKGYGYGTYGPT
eukprot:TRINITY_DN35465_c0_g1_i1.p1 TRINITY_DN35465_c0_g1~~TRINITY_DN35465_c0_g1_i1.p1  ORF type:complete len:335 (-),score=59.77 TRINITY_DN35465_c0_g1_i1:132-1136(-)